MYLTDETLPEFREWARHAEMMAFDVETVGLSPEDLAARLRYAQVGDDRRVWIVTERYRFALAQALTEARLPLAHNGLFDAAWLEQRWGIPMGKVIARTVDTQLLGMLYDPRIAYTWGEDEPDQDTPTGLGLKELAVRFLGPEADAAERALNEAFDLPADRGSATWAAKWASIPDDHPLLLAYARADVVLTARLYRMLWAGLNGHERTDLWPVEQRVYAAAYRMMRRGIHVDTDAADRMRHVLLGVADGRDAHLLDAYGLDNPRSSRQCAEALLGDGATLTKRTKGGELSTDRKVLEGLGSGLSLAIRDARQARRYATTYAGKLADGPGLIHPGINVTGARTGRWSMSDPPLQQWPRDPFHGMNLRSMFTAPPGMHIVTVDLSSIEVVVGAAVSGDPRLLTAVGPGAGDKIRVYDDLAARLGVPRGTAKTVFLSGQYGAGPARCAWPPFTAERSAGCMPRAADAPGTGMTTAKPSIAETTAMDVRRTL